MIERPCDQFCSGVLTMSSGIGVEVSAMMRPCRGRGRGLMEASATVVRSSAWCEKHAPARGRPPCGDHALVPHRLCPRPGREGGVLGVRADFANLCDGTIPVRGGEALGVAATGAGLLEEPRTCSWPAETVSMQFAIASMTTSHCSVFPKASHAKVTRSAHSLLLIFFVWIKRKARTHV